MAVIKSILSRTKSLSGKREVYLSLDVCSSLTCIQNDEVAVNGSITMDPAPPFACKFNPLGLHGNLLSLVDEEGSVRLLDTRKTLEDSLMKEWQAHKNAIFDVQWASKEKMVTASGDASLILWDVSYNVPIASFKGHRASVKSVNVKSDSPDMLVSAGRDGCVLLWDTRYTVKGSSHRPVNAIHMAHTKVDSEVNSSRKSTPTRRHTFSRKKSISKSIDTSNGVTAALFYRENMVASSGAADGTVKLWDTRRIYSSNRGKPLPAFTFSCKRNSQRTFGFTSLITDSYHSNLYAGCMDNIVYVFDGTTLKPHPVNGFSGHCASFYVKMDTSPCGRFLLSGSSCGNAFIWDTKNALDPPILLSGHTKEVTAVSWAPNQFDKIATCSDACDVRIWRNNVVKSSLLQPEYIGHAVRYNGTDHTHWLSCESRASPPVSKLPQPVLRPVENVECGQLRDVLQNLPIKLQSNSTSMQRKRPLCLQDETENVKRKCSIAQCVINRTDKQFKQRNNGPIYRYCKHIS